MCINTNDYSLIIFFDTSGLNKQDKYSVTLLVTEYICTMWNNRESQYDGIKLLKKRIFKNVQINKLILGNKMPQTLNSMYCSITQRLLDDITIVD